MLSQSKLFGLLVFGAGKENKSLSACLLFVQFTNLVFVKAPQQPDAATAMLYYQDCINNVMLR